MTAEDYNNSATSQKKLLLRLALGIAAPIALLSTPACAGFFTSVASSNIFTGNFEKGDFSGWQQEVCCDYSAQIVSSPKRAGRYATKFKLYKTDPDVSSSRRAELRLKPVPANSERWYGFSVFVPQEYAKDRSYEIITQWAALPDFDLGETWRTPVLTLSIKNDQFRVSNRWDFKPVNVIFKEAGSQGWNLGTIAKGQWTDWVFHVKWSHKPDGLIEVWKNGKLVVSKAGPNNYNDKRGPFLKMGIYKPDWKYNNKSKTTERVIYFDEVRIGDARANYKDVVPRL